MGPFLKNTVLCSASYQVSAGYRMRHMNIGLGHSENNHEFAWREIDKENYSFTVFPVVSGTVDIPDTTVHDMNSLVGK